MSSYTREQAQSLRLLKGAPASIVLSLLITAASLKSKDLQLVTGYSDKSIADALALLELHGWVQHNGRSYGWSLTTQLALPELKQLPEPIRKLSVFEPLLSSSSDDLNKEKIKGSGEEEEEEEAKSWLLRAGIGRNSPKMRELMEMSLDPHYVRCWVLEFEAWQQQQQTPGFQGRKVFTIGTLIHILLSEDQQPKERCRDCLEPLPCHCRYIRT